MMNKRKGKVAWCSGQLSAVEGVERLELGLETWVGARTWMALNAAEFLEH